MIVNLIRFSHLKNPHIPSPPYISRKLWKKSHELFKTLKVNLYLINTDRRIIKNTCSCCHCQHIEPPNEGPSLI